MRARSRIAVLAAGTLGLSAALVSAGSLTTANASGPVAQPAGQLVLSTYAGTATGDGWSYGAASQAITTAASSCIVSSPNGSLVNVSGNAATSGVPGFASHSLGVTQSATISSACRQVGFARVTTAGVTTSKAESLTIALNNVDGAFTSAEFGASKATSASLDLELKDETKVQAQLFDGTTLVGTFKLYSDEDPRPSSLPADWTYCRNGLGSSDGSDPNGPKDNCRWTVAPTAGAYFDSIVLTPIAGWFSLEGGGDFGASAASNRTTFDIVQFYDGVTVCGSGISVLGEGAGSINGLLTPLGSASGVACTGGTPYTVDSTPDGLTFHKPASDGGQYTIALTREFPNASASDYPAPGLQVDWEKGEGPLPLHLCPAGLISGALNPDGTPTSVDLSVIAGQDQSALAPDQQFACIYGSTGDYDRTTGVLTTTDLVWFTGDILLTTKR